MCLTVAVHPDPQQLARFRLGALSPEEVEEIASHVADCSDCCGSLRRLPDDSLVGLVRQSLPTGAETTEAPGLPGDLIDHPRYEVLELLGSGGMGSVYKARHRLMDRLVALKVIRPRLLERPGVVERFRREVKAAGGLLHPNIVTAHDAEQAGATHFLIMEFVEGVTLAQRVAADGPLSPAEACACVRQAAQALQHAHERGMVHRDIKPHNLMRTPDGRVKVLDFGLARFASEVGSEDDALPNPTDADGPVTMAGMVLGTVDYIAPEQLRDPHTADVRADVYSLGRTLCFLLTGHPQPTEDTAMHTLTPPRLRPILNRMLDEEPDRRYQTPAEVADALMPFTQSRTRRRRGGFLVLALAFLLLGGGIAAAVYRIATDKGEIIIDTDDPEVEVVIRQAGREVTIIDPKTRHKIEVRSGEYEIALGGAAGDLRLSTDHFTLKRGDKKLVAVRRVPAAEKTMTWENRQGTWRELFAPAPFAVPPGGAEPKPTPPTPRAEREALREIRRFEGHTDGVSSVAFSPDGKLALSGAALTDADHAVRVWDVASGKEVRRLEGHTSGVTSVAFSPDGKRVLSGSDDRTIRLWDLATGKEFFVSEGHKDKVLAVAFWSLGSRIASGSADKTIGLWDATTGKFIHSLTGHTDAVRTLAFSPDGKRFASGSLDGTIRLWDVAKEVAVLKGHRRGVQSVIFSPNSRCLVSGGLDGEVLVWEVSAGKVLFGRKGPTAGVSAVVITPDAGRILAAGQDGEVVVWRVERLQHQQAGAAEASGLVTQEHRFHAHKGAVRSLAVSPDGRFLLSGGDDKLLRLWGLPK